MDAVRSITTKYEFTHENPIDWGFHGAVRLRISDPAKPEYEDAIDIEDDEIPVFRGCGTAHLATECWSSN